MILIIAAVVFAFIVSVLLAKAKVYSRFLSILWSEDGKVPDPNKFNPPYD